MSSYTDDDFVTIGTPFEVPEDNEPLPKPSKVEDQIATDKQGRRRFHGAFTGGFSAGYFNTVGSKEGFSPATFKSSKSTKNKKENEVGQVYKPEDFMDDEDFSEHGIKPKRLKTVSGYDEADTQLQSKKKSLLRNVEEGNLHSAVPGGIPLDDFLAPTDHSVGIKLLKKLGWKPGQGVGEKVVFPKEEVPVIGPKRYGCALPPQTRTFIDFDSFAAMLAPKDVAPLKFNQKDNLHGIGYSGLTSYFGSKSEANSKCEKEFQPLGKGSRGIRGQAFGIGIFEENDDCDVYGSTDFSKYDMTMCEESDPRDGWSGTTEKPKKYKDCLSGFIKSLEKLNLATKLNPIPGNVPNTIPKHVFTETTLKGTVENTKLSYADRSDLLGETNKTIKDTSHWTLKWDKNEGHKNSEEKSQLNNVIEKACSSIVKDKPSVMPKEEEKAKMQCKNKKTHNTDGVFKPFSSNLSKQARYEIFLSCKDKYFAECENSSMTEWEMKQELAEFSRAATLYKPLSAGISDRFVSACDSMPSSSSHTGLNEDIPPDKKAAQMGMFGKLTRTVLEWHPEPLLCKRSNIPNPYPNSTLRGVPIRNKKKTSIFSENFVHDLKTITTEEIKPEKESSDEDEFISRLQKNKSKILKNKSGPLSHLNIKLGKEESDQEQKESQVENSAVDKENVVKPSIDIFKAIFENSDSEFSDQDENDKQLKDNKSISTIKLDESSPVNLQTSLPAFSTVETLTKPSDIKEEVHVNISKSIISPNEKTGKFLPLAFLNDVKVNTSVSKEPSNLDKSKDPGGVVCAICTKTTEVMCTSVPSHQFTASFSSSSTSSVKPSITTDETWSEKPETKKQKESKHGGISHKSKKRKKKSKKSRTHEKYEHSSSESDDSVGKEKKRKSAKKEKKKKKKRKHKSSSSSSSESNVPSDKVLLEKLKRNSDFLSRRPTAADFM